MFSRLPQAAMALAMACSLGLHWTLFQSVAWLGMVVNYSEDATFQEALAKTFDGKHPCSLCKRIAQEKKSEKKSDSRAELRKLEFFFTASGFVFNQPRRFWQTREREGSTETRAQAPPVPPPKAFPA